MQDSANGSAAERCVIYLSPVYPSISETFVVDELRMLGSVIPTKLISVRKGSDPCSASVDVNWVGAIYDSNPVLFFLSGIGLLLQSERSVRSCTLLLHDLWRVSGVATKLKVLYQFLAGAHLSKKLEKEGCIHLHIHFAHVPATIGMYACALSNIPFTVMGHANDIFERPILLLEKAVRATQFFTISDYNKKYLVNSGLPEEKISVVRCVPSFRASPEISQIHNVSSKSTIVIGSLGRLVEKKGMRVLIHAINELRHEGHNVRLEVAGDGPLKQQLLKQVESLNLQTEVSFVGAIPHFAVAEWMRNLDVFVLACVEDSNGDVDGIPVSLMEAMSQGVPVISTSISGIPELIKDEQTGILVRPNDSVALASGLTRLFKESELRATLVRNAQVWLAREFGRETNLRRLVHGMGLSTQ